VSSLYRRIAARSFQFAVAFRDRMCSRCPARATSTHAKPGLRKVNLEASITEPLKLPIQDSEA
jgi:hypothetical protein